MDHIYNFRDFGGYPAQGGAAIKQGLLFRSGSLAQASPADLRTLAALDIRTLCDLRAPRERRDEPDRLPPGNRLRVVHLPVLPHNQSDSSYARQAFSFLFGKMRRQDFSEFACQFYREYVSRFTAEFAALLHLAADSDNLPMLIHCTAGKDRTGFACSLIQSALGTPANLVMQEYLLSNQYLLDFRLEMLRKLRAFAILGATSRRFQPLFEVRGEYLSAAYEQAARQYGTLAAYLQDGLGISPTEQGQLRATLLR